MSKKFSSANFGSTYTLKNGFPKDQHSLERYFSKILDIIQTPEVENI